MGLFPVPGAPVGAHNFCIIISRSLISYLSFAKNPRLFLLPLIYLIRCMIHFTLSSDDFQVFSQFFVRQEGP